MKPTISIGTQDFEFLRKNHYFFIDKTGFIKEWWENGDAVTLITRPRRFGKTLNLNMLECFFSKKYEGRADLFDGLSIWQEESYRLLQGSYPVIFLSFANIKGESFETVRMGIIQKLVKLYSTYSYVKDGSLLNEKDLAFFDSVKPDMKDDVAILAIQYMSDYLSRYYGKKVLIFLDEYDTPLQEAYVYGYWEELTSFIRSLFNSTFKTNPYMERGLMTGITRISKESIFSDLNNLTVITTTSEKYCTQFGFTEEEVFRSLETYGMSDRAFEVKAWYDGFTFGSQKDIYNPWSITSFLVDRQLKPYWANSSSNALVSKLIQQGNPQTKIIMEDLLAGGSFTTELDEEIIFDQLLKKRGAVWSLLLASGYLTVKDKLFDADTGRFSYCLELTNREVKMMFEDIVRDWFSDETIPYHDFLRAFLHGDLDYMNEYMNQVAERTFSSFDVGKSPSETANPERFYHGFVLGLMVELSGNYKISSNRESGFGRYDVMLEPLERQKTAYILEFKVHNPKKEPSLADTLKAALDQIEEKNYDMELISRGIPKERIRHYGFVFEGKHVLIG